MDERPGFLCATFTGKGAHSLFKDESGGHRWQRIPPTEKKGRVQTSTVTVAVMTMADESVQSLNLADVEFKMSRGSGPGGQHRNKTDSCVTATHRPTGETARVDLRSQHRSKAVAIQILASRINDRHRSSASESRNSDRRRQVGAGMRGDKVRTYREQDDSVVDHRNERRMKLKHWTRGDWTW